MAWDHYEYRISKHYLSALINGDDTGLDDSDAAEFWEWEKQARDDAGGPGHWTDVDGSGGDWGRCDVSGLFAMRCTVRYMVRHE